MEAVLIEPMTEALILWRCLHSGPLSAGTIEKCPAAPPLPWPAYWQRNVPLLVKLTRTYGACAILARVGPEVVGLLRFYPKAVWEQAGAGELCLQQDPPGGPAADFADAPFTPLDQLADKTLVVHCLMTGSPQQTQNPYQRRGIGTRLMVFLIQWAKERGWERIEARTFEDLPIMYEISGVAGRTFWQKLGFTLHSHYPHPNLQEPSEFVQTLEAQARACGISPEQAKEELVMRLELGGVDATGLAAAPLGIRSR